MASVAVDLLTAQMNNAVLRLPERRYPGVLVQGDTLASLADLACTIERLLPPNADTSLIESTRELRERLDSMLRFYEVTLEAAGIQLPYARDPHRGEDSK